jgi:monoamine oxidase
MSLRLARYRDARRESRRTEIDLDEVVSAREATPSSRAMTRRDFMKLGGAAAAAGAIGARLRGERARARVDEPRVAIVGAGTAGLTAAYEIFRRTRWTARVFEASDRPGGRMRTIRGLPDGGYTEAGGGGISGNEKAIARLCRHLGLDLVDTWRNYPDGEETYYFGGRHYTFAELEPGIHAISGEAFRAWKAIGRRIPSYERHNAAASVFDDMSVDDFLSQRTDFGPSTPAGSFISHDQAIEYGGTSDLSSSLELILEEGAFWGASPYDERWAIEGGNDRLPQELAGRLPPGAISYGHRLVALRRLTDASYRLTFEFGSSYTDVIADHVVCAVPANGLRSVDLEGAGISPVHMLAIRQMSLGTNAKLNFGFSGQPWAGSGRNGDSTSDSLVSSTWQASFLGGDRAILVAMNNKSYPGVDPHGSLPSSELAPTLAAIDSLFPDSGASFIPGQAYLDVWVNDPYIGGSYQYDPLGAFTSYGGVENKREGNIHFAGEHTARYTRAGTMEGAVESGLRAARAVTND